MVRLLQHECAGEGGRQDPGAVAGGEDEGQAAGAQGVGDGKALAPAQVDVEHGDVDIDPARQFQGLLEVGRQRRHLVAEVAQHVLDEQGDDDLVLHDEDTALVSGRAHVALPSSRIASSGASMVQTTPGVR